MFGLGPLVKVKENYRCTMWQQFEEGLYGCEVHMSTHFLPYMVYNAQSATNSVCILIIYLNNFCLEKQKFFQSLFARFKLYRQKCFYT